MWTAAWFSLAWTTALMEVATSAKEKRCGLLPLPLLTMMMAQVTDLVPGELIVSLGDTHIYSNHFEQVKEQLTREPRELPTMTLNPAVKSLFDFKFEDFKLPEYHPLPAIKAPIAV